MFSSKNQFLTGAGGYKIQRSVRFRSSATAYLTRTYTTPTNNKIFTWSAWIKRGLISAASGGTTYYRLLSSNTNTDEAIRFSSDALQVFFNGTTSGNIQTTQLFRDTFAWYHVVVAVDTTQATAANRVKIYVNGSQVTAFSTASYPAQNYTTSLNAAGSVYTSCAQSLIEYFDGYIAENNFIDGQQLTPSSFGQTDPVTGVWQPIKYTGTYGTNGYYLNFSDNSASTATTIGKDYSGNGNNWTPNNISVTAGTTYDSMLDSPTPYADGGNGRGNYPVLNSLKIYTGAGSNLALTDGNLTATNTAAQTGLSIATIRMPSTGKWYWEVTNVAGSGLLCYAGMVITEANADANSATISGNYRSNGAITNIAGTAQTSGATYTAGDVIGVAVDVDNGTVQFYKNGAAQGATPSFTFTAGTILVPTVANDNSAGTKTFAANFGQRPFSATPPTGFVALNTQNLPTPAIANGAAYMAATTYTGTGASLAVTNTVNGISFQPDFVWTKVRNNTYSNHLEDAVRGVGQRLLSDSNVAEATGTNGKLTAFNSNGFTQDGGVEVGASAGTYVGWQWNAGGSTVTNTNGSISAQVRANTTAGFSIATYTGTGANATVGHGLGVAPKMILVKKRSGIQSWSAYHASLANTQYLVLNTTAAAATLATMWNSTSPTSSVFSVGTDGNVNASAATYVAYCFSEVAGYSKIGSYTGNGSADGPFVYCGFRPKFVLVKAASGTSAGSANWLMLDSSRSVYNATDNKLAANLTDAENSAGIGGAGVNSYDFLSNGIKARTTSGSSNENNTTYIFMAFAENPFKNSLAR